MYQNRQQLNIAYPDGVGERDGDRQRKTLGNGDDEDRDGDDEEVYKVLDVCRLPGQLLRAELFDAQSYDENDKRSDRHRRPCTTGTEYGSIATITAAVPVQPE